MNYTYRIEKTWPSDGIIQVIYSTAGLPDLGANIALPQGFTQQTLDQMIEANAPISTWQRLQNKPDISGIHVGAFGNKTYAAPTPPVPTLAEAKAQAEAEIDAAATRARRRYISPNKDATYINKAAELDRWIAAGRPNAPAQGTFPYIETEANETGQAVTVTAESIEAARNAWLQLDPFIEGMARGGKVAANAATTVDDVQAAAGPCVNNLNSV